MKGISTALLLCGIVLLGVSSSIAQAAEPAGEASGLKEADQKLLARLLKEILCDPRGAQFVRVKTVCHSAWGHSSEIAREGWLKSDKGADRVFFTDGWSIPAPAPEKMEKLDFLDFCRKRIAEAEKKPSEEEERKAIFGNMRMTADGYLGESNLMLAAWLLALDQPDLASKALLLARENAEESQRSRADDEESKKVSIDDRLVLVLKDDLAWEAFAGMVHAYMVRADQEAFEHGERLLRLYPESVKKEYTQAEAIMAELKRRKEKGTFGKTPSEGLPEGFAAWEPEKKVAWLIDSLEEVDVRQWGQPGGVPLGMDHRVAALIQLGDPAVPSLIDTIEKDERLTRSVHFWRDFARDRTVLSVREAALTAVMSILKVHAFEPVATGDNFTSRGSDENAKVVKQLREYWKKNGNQPLTERMMNVLTNPKSDFKATQEAAHNLGHYGERSTISTTVFSDFLAKLPEGPNPVIEKFSKPTVAEAILAAMDRDLAHHDQGEHDQLFDYDRRHIEDSYFEPLLHWPTNALSRN